MTKQITHSNSLNQDNFQEEGFFLLVQDACPECERLKRMLAGPLKGQYDSSITLLHRQDNEDAFQQLAKKHSIRTTPAFINSASGEVLLRTGLGEVKAFLSR